MIRRRLYLLLLLLLIAGVTLKNKPLFTFEGVEAGEEPGSYADGFYTLISEEANEKGITLIVDGREADSSKAPVRMAKAGSFLIPVAMLPKSFQVTAHLYDHSKLVMERAAVRAELSMKEKGLLVNGAEFPMDEELKVLDRCLYVPAQAVEKAFSYEAEWDPEKNRLAMTYKGKEKRALPSLYDYRKEGRAPQVKNQGSLGTCWAFASLMALESRLLPEEQFSFSEDHMSISNSFHMQQNDGGEATMSMAYLLAWQGPVLEKQDAYGDGYSPPGLKPVKHVQEIQILPGKDYEAIKRAVYYCGGVQSSLYTSMASGRSDSRYYNKEKGAYCYIGTAKPNHDIVIIGWDDNYPKENFNLDLEGDGAFICANSWGGEFGDEGYFYVSYYDTNIGIHNILYTKVENTDNYDKIYQTDLCGWSGQLGYGREDAYFANSYTAGEDEELAAAGFYATGPDTSYEVYTVTDAEDSSSFGSRRLAARGSFQNEGYYTVDFDKPVGLKKGQKFAVIVNIKTPGSVHPVAIEYPVQGRGAKKELSDGEGYISLRGTSWERVEESQKCNLCLKAYTRTVKDEAVMKEEKGE